MKTTVTDGQLTQFLRILKQKKVTPDRFQCVLANGILSDVFDERADLMERQDWRDALKLDLRDTAIVVDYDLTREEMEKQAHCYAPGTVIYRQEQDGKLLKPKTGKDKLWARLFKLEYPVSSVAEVGKQFSIYYRHANLWELLAFMRMLDRDLNVAALGTLMQDALLSSEGLQWSIKIEPTSYSNDPTCPRRQLVTVMIPKDKIEGFFPNSHCYYLAVREVV